MNQLLDSLIRQGNYFDESGGGTNRFFDNAKLVLNGIISDLEVNSGFSAAGGTGGNPTAHWDVPVVSNSLPVLQIEDANVFSPQLNYLQFNVQSQESSDFLMHTLATTEGWSVGNGLYSCLRAITLSQSASLTTIATSCAFPYDSVGYFEVYVAAHRKDGIAGKSATWKFIGTFEVSATPTLSIVDGPTQFYAYIGDVGAYTTPTMTVTGATLLVQASGNTNTDSTWVTRIVVNVAQAEVPP